MTPLISTITGALPTPVRTPDEPILGRVSLSATHKSAATAPQTEQSPPSPPDPRENNSKSSSGSTVKHPTSKSRERPQSIELPQTPVFSIETTTSPDTLVSSRATDSSTAGLLAPTDQTQFEPGMPVLVVDDDPLTRMLMKRLLTRLGCVVSTADNGEKALEMITGSSSTTPASESTSTDPGFSSSQVSMQGIGRKYAIVFLDNQMPVLSGIEAVAVSIVIH
jgi:osomolarity two-component system, sensor histidine kinase SLN1